MRHGEASDPTDGPYDYARERADLPDGLYTNGDSCGPEDGMDEVAYADLMRRRGW